MRRLLIASGVSCLLAGIAALGWWYYAGQERVTQQIATYRIGTAANFQQAQRDIVRFEQGPGLEAKLAQLVAGWGTGNSKFDLYLARHLGSAQCSEALRKAFSLELAWRPVLLARWAHYWSWQTKQQPSEEVASIVRYLEALQSADNPPEITWRQVLEVQAVFILSGQPDLATRLSPDNLVDRYRRWSQSVQDGQLAAVQRPEQPFPD
jgi:hypothetical protein